MQYRIISVKSVWSTQRAIEELTQEVERAIALGWEPLGGLAVMTGFYAQAMIKRR